MKRRSSFATMCFLIAVHAVSVLGRDSQSGSGSKPKQLDMDQTMMALQTHHHHETQPQSQPPTTISASNGNVRQATGSFKSETKEISFELFEPLAAGKYPVIVMLYGSGGMTVGGPLFRLTAQALARAGYVVYLPHYFEKTGTLRATPADDIKYFATWMRTIGDSLDYAKNQPNVDAKRIALIGFSLGAYLSLSVASINNEVKAVVDYFGGLPDFFGKQLQTMAPTLILHGEADKIVPVAEAYKLESLLKNKKSPYEIKVYPQQGHGFNGSAAADAMQRTFAFLEKNLKKAGQ